MPSPPAPRLEMLWEAADSGVVILERFGFADAESAGAWIAATVHDHWDIRIASCERIVMSDHNALAWLTTPTGPVVAKWSRAGERFVRLAGVARLTSWLAAQGVPVSAPIASRDGRLQVEVDRASMGLQHVVRGELLDVGDDDQLRAAGAALARLHRALRDYPETDRIVPWEQRPAPLAGRIVDWVDSAGRQVPPAARDTLIRLVAEAPTSIPPSQLLHGDFRSANVLCVERDVAAIIDFEEVRIGCRVDELARSALLLGTRFHNWAPVSADVRAGFLSAYLAAWPVTPVERQWLDILLLWYAFALVPTGDDPTGWGASALNQLARFA